MFRCSLWKLSKCVENALVNLEAMLELWPVSYNAQLSDIRVLNSFNSLLVFTRNKFHQYPIGNVRNDCSRTRNVSYKPHVSRAFNMYRTTSNSKINAEYHLSLLWIAVVQFQWPYWKCNNTCWPNRFMLIGKLDLRVVFFRVSEQSACAFSIGLWRFFIFIDSNKLFSYLISYICMIMLHHALRPSLAQNNIQPLPTLIRFYSR